MNSKEVRAFMKAANKDSWNGAVAHSLIDGRWLVLSLIIEADGGIEPLLPGFYIVSPWYCSLILFFKMKEDERPEAQDDDLDLIANAVWWKEVEGGWSKEKTAQGPAIKR